MSSKGKVKVPDNIQGKFSVQQKLGSGCFGEVYKGRLIETGEDLAIKFEAKNVDVPQLKHEANILNLVNPHNGPDALGFAFCHFYGIEGAFNVLVMPLMSKSLEDCVQKNNGKFSVKTTLVIADQLLKRLEYLHSKSHVHRDIKPENFMWGAGEKMNVLHMIDFGLSKKYYDQKHIPFKEGRSLTGTARYASIAVHLGHEQGRRDDLEAVGHMLMYFLRGSLPWSGLDAKTKEEKYKRICTTKQETKLDVLCATFPPAFAEYLQITRGLTFTARPDYVKLRKLFSAEFEKNEWEEDFDFEWFKGKKPQMMDIPPWKNLAQPDDNKPTASKATSKEKPQQAQDNSAVSAEHDGSANLLTRAKNSMCCALM
jgi:casein kinase 1